MKKFLKILLIVIGIVFLIFAALICIGLFVDYDDHIENGRYTYVPEDDNKDNAYVEFNLSDYDKKDSELIYYSSVEEAILNSPLKAEHEDLSAPEDFLNHVDEILHNYDSRQKPSVRPRIREPTPEQKYQKEENHCYKVLTDYFHLLREWEKKYAPKQPDEEWNPLFAEALYKKNYIEYLLDILLYGSLEERKALVAEQRKEVLKLEQRIAELSADRTMHSRRNPKQLRAERER